MDYFYSIPIKEASCSSWLPQQEQQLSQGTMKNSAASQVQSWEREHVIFYKHQYYLTYYLLPVFLCEKKMGLGLSLQMALDWNWDRTLCNDWSHDPCSGYNLNERFELM